MTLKAIAAKDDKVQAPRQQPGGAAWRHGGDARAARAVLLHSAEKPLPEGLKVRLLSTPDGFELRCATARPAQAHGTVLIVPGRGDYIERHYETIQDILDRRLAVVIFDWRGQGLSQRLLKNRLKGHIRSFAEYETDLETVVRQVLLPDMPLPHCALAVSMGGHVLLKASWKHVWFDRALLISPFIDFPPHRHARLLRLLARVGPWLGLGRAFFPTLRKTLLAPEDFPDNPITSDQRRFERETRFLQQHPELGVAAPTIGWMHAALRSVEEFRRMVAAGGEPRWPNLALAAAHDKLVDPQALRRLAKEVGNLKATFLQQARHDITMERDELRNLMWAEFDSFITEYAQLVQPPQPPFLSPDMPLPAT